MSPTVAMELRQFLVDLRAVGRLENPLILFTFDESVFYCKGEPDAVGPLNNSPGATGCPSHSVDLPPRTQLCLSTFTKQAT